MPSYIARTLSLVASLVAIASVLLTGFLLDRFYGRTDMAFWIIIFLVPGAVTGGLTYLTYRTLTAHARWRAARITRREREWERECLAPFQAVQHALTHTDPLAAWSAWRGRTNIKVRVLDYLTSFEQRERAGSPLHTWMTGDPPFSWRKFFGPNTPLTEEEAKQRVVTSLYKTDMLVEIKPRLQQLRDRSLSRNERRLIAELVTDRLVDYGRARDDYRYILESELMLDAVDAISLTLRPAKNAGPRPNTPPEE